MLHEDVAHQYKEPIAIKCTLLQGAPLKPLYAILALAIVGVHQHKYCTTSSTSTNTTSITALLALLGCYMQPGLPVGRGLLSSNKESTGPSYTILAL